MTPMLNIQATQSVELNVCAYAELGNMPIDRMTSRKPIGSKIERSLVNLPICTTPETAA